MTIRLSVLTLLLSMCFLACTSTNKVISTKKYPKAILGKWHVIKISSDKKGDMPMPPNVSLYFEYFEDGKFDADLGGKRSGTYTLTDAKMVMTIDDDPANCDITHLSKDHMNIVLHDSGAEDLSFFMSKFPPSDDKSVFKEMTN